MVKKGKRNRRLQGGAAALAPARPPINKEDIVKLKMKKSLSFLFKKIRIKLKEKWLNYGGIISLNKI
ncbi:hypothetical protein CY0110_06734 [Crocosphaera chwakensis CCY0110]|uniref:Uncharacterized protein n=1 Tax=Crocosphaera chwakensis CCY0110 TaxID=391612 RepID=A3IWB3_9CHRO|nr:hypothetical protein CY0110_06599 [Crocosphaera chwakensis CCY0110]EAZ89226.1 hypothetical protein CY0110_06734 [Crocosphaera chwakensis CCY0110]